MAWPDIAIVGVVIMSVLVGVLRGFVKEVLSLVVWIAAFFVALQFSGSVAEWMAGSITLPSARTALAFGGLFLGVLAVGGLLTYLVGKLVESTGLSGTDRLLGGVFGTIRGVLLVVILLIAAAFTPLPRDPWWQESPMIAAMLPLAEWAAEWLPASVAEHLDFHPEPEPAEAQAA